MRCEAEETGTRYLRRQWFVIWPLDRSPRLLAGGCTKYDQPELGDGCEKFASDHGITPADLYAWNSVLGSRGDNCGSQFFLGYYYCIAGPASTAPPVPSPTQAGITSKCNSYTKAVKGEYCSLFAQEHGVSLSDLYAWNGVLGANGENCGTAFFADYYYCTGVSS
ncbi:LysM domain-containing protein [Apiospora kogelbergensis]|uniref:LysM domain-containing protein n=1 Tax=Apiospora kogelbergensis TaxID=1337665 RepID=A0AAW0R8Y4_9PEZI